ncbi:MAG TPA: RNA polymerase factor sigma-54, partial [Methylothermaceae bacterium]|nr:RNA polymerase factor sigma-54 [Methylothermaceae bacterium]
MKQSLQLRLGQQLTMTPQLQQAIRLLQLSSLELKHEIQDALESNIMLEIAEEEKSTQENQPGETNPATITEDQPVSADSEDIPSELPLDANWDDVFDTVYS